MYNGDGDFLPSTSCRRNSNRVPGEHEHDAGSMPNPSVFGQSVTLTATVSAVSPGAERPRGQLLLRGCDAAREQQRSMKGTSRQSRRRYCRPDRPVTAVYSGDHEFPEQHLAVATQIVNQANTTTTVSSLPNPSLINQSVTLTATVAAISPGSGNPTGTVILWTARPLGSLHS